MEKRYICWVQQTLNGKTLTFYLLLFPSNKGKRLLGTCILLYEEFTARMGLKSLASLWLHCAGPQISWLGKQEAWGRVLGSHSTMPAILPFTLILSLLGTWSHFWLLKFSST
jgi:hypothetical protein